MIGKVRECKRETIGEEDESGKKGKGERGVDEERKGGSEKRREEGSGRWREVTEEEEGSEEESSKRNKEADEDTGRG